MKTILYFYPVQAAFVESDYHLLSEKHRVKQFYFNGANKLLTPWYFFKQLLFLCFHVWSSHRFVSQFSGYHSFLPSVFSRIFGRAHYIILNGTECNNFPEYNYGYVLRPLLFWFSSKSLKWATKLLPVSEALVYSEYTYADTRYAQQGFKYFYKELATPYEVVYNGISKDRFELDTTQSRTTDNFITVATGLSSGNRRAIKGIDLVIELARLTPENHFTFIGAENDRMHNLPENITLIGNVPNSELSRHYNQHAFYLQLSATEGFGIAVCEAMVCGCTPIVSDVGILPFIASEKGYVLRKKDLDDLVNLIKKAQSEYDPSHAVFFRNHIVKNFDLSKRREKLFNLLDELV